MYMYVCILGKYNTIFLGNTDNFDWLMCVQVLVCISILVHVLVHVYIKIDIMTPYKKQTISKYVLDYGDG